MDPIEFHNKKRKSTGFINCLITDIFKMSVFVFNRRKKLIQVWNEMRWSK